ncbi:TrmB family transcriptional regulator [Candidatus Uhrbacteria bacterium]|nr:TrmB family transcriptional regulator [Candidatus Uhrbacteria bacterium]
MDISHLLHELGFAERETKVYLMLLTGGPSSVRKLAKDTDLNRGSVYDGLKNLQSAGLVGYFQKHKKQFFVAEDPEKLLEVVENRERQAASLRRNIAEVLPELKSLHVHGGAKTVVKYYEGPKGVNIILRDVLRTMSESPDKTYRIYSSSLLRDYLYREFPQFTRERIARGLKVKVIAVGPGGEDQSLAERRWLSERQGSPTYSIIYASKVAFISLDKNDAPIGVLIEDGRIADTERMVFEHVWRTLGPEAKNAVSFPAATVISAKV